MCASYSVHSFHYADASYLLPVVAYAGGGGSKCFNLYPPKAYCSILGATISKTVTKMVLGDGIWG